MTQWLPVAVEHANPPVVAVMSQFAKYGSLITAYPFVQGHSPVATLTYYNRVVKGFKILDSGIFTLSKESLQGTKFSLESLKTYTRRYLYMVEKLGIDYPIVEMDSHGLWLDGNGAKWLPELRRMFVEAGRVDQTVHVWHNNEGQDTWDAMCRKYKRLSVSKVELSEIGMPASVFDNMLLRNRKHLADRHVHMLGEGSPTELTKHGDNYTADSSSWNSIMLFGECIVGGRKVAEYRGGKLRAPEWVLDMISDRMSDMINVYRHHPQYKRGTKVRVKYMQVIATGLISYVSFMESLRKKTTGTKPGTSCDPLSTRTPCPPRQ